MDKFPSGSQSQNLAHILPLMVGSSSIPEIHMNAQRHTDNNHGLHKCSMVQIFLNEVSVHDKYKTVKLFFLLGQVFFSSIDVIYVKLLFMDFCLLMNFSQLLAFYATPWHRLLADFPNIIQLAYFIFLFH